MSDVAQVFERVRARECRPEALDELAFVVVQLLLQRDTDALVECRSQAARPVEESYAAGFFGAIRALVTAGEAHLEPVIPLREAVDLLQNEEFWRETLVALEARPLGPSEVAERVLQDRGKRSTAFRLLQRIREAGLITTAADGLYTLTATGQQALKKVREPVQAGRVLQALLRDLRSPEGLGVLQLGQAEDPRKAEAICRVLLREQLVGERQGRLFWCGQSRPSQGDGFFFSEPGETSESKSPVKTPRAPVMSWRPRST